MTPDDQKRLFKQVVKHFPQWSYRKCSGYVHGIVDQDRNLPPSPDMIERWANDHHDMYAMGYLYGYADAYGLDAQVESWSISPSAVIEYHWWKK